MYDVLIKNACVIDGSGEPGKTQTVAVKGDRIIFVTCAEDPAENTQAKQVIDGTGLVLCPGFIDVHTHDDLNVIRNPQMREKISQGVTTVVVGNCGISASPVYLGEQYYRASPPDPMNLLGEEKDFQYQHFSKYVNAINTVKPMVNVVALVGHTSLRSNCMDTLDRAANPREIEEMKTQLKSSLEEGAIGLSSGLAYGNAQSAPKAELEALVEVVADYDGVYTTHLRTEFEGILGAMDEAFETADKHKVPLIISHLKCAGKPNWGRSQELTHALTKAGEKQNISCDCYPYSASSSTLDLNQVTAETEIFITWSESVPEAAGNTLKALAAKWQMGLIETAEKIMPAGAVYHCMDDADVKHILAYDKTMIGSDGLPCDPHPHPRLWGSFPRVIAHYSQKENVFSLETAIHKMTGKSAGNFRLEGRGKIQPNYFADLVLFDPKTIDDSATYENPIQASAGILAVWVNGVCSYSQGNKTPTTLTNDSGAGRFLAREKLNEE